MTRRRVCVLQTARLGSTRVPRKLLQVVGGRTLLEIGLDKLLKIERLSGATCLLGVHEGDRELVDGARAKGVGLFFRDLVSVQCEKYDDYARGWSVRLADRFDWVLSTNILCRPFVRCASVVKMCEVAESCAHPFVTVCRSRGIVWNEGKTCVVGQGQTANTRENPVYYTLAHMGYGTPVEIVDNEAAIVRDLQLLELEMTDEEHVDIDTPAQLDFARRVGTVFDTSGD